MVSNAVIGIRESISNRWTFVLSYQLYHNVVLNSIKLLKNGKEDMMATATLDAKQSTFFDHRDPSFVKWLGER
nr:hypothetical protein [uncultured Chryseobacterium sp.]